MPHENINDGGGGSGWCLPIVIALVIGAVLTAILNDDDDQPAERRTKHELRDKMDDYYDRHPGRAYENVPDSLSQHKRMKIFLEMSYGEYEAQKRGDYSDTYRNNIAERYGLTRQQINAIAGEGISKGWPTE